MKKMSKQDVETVIFENAKTGEALEFQHEQHKAEYGAKHFWKADKKFFELLSTFSAAESKVVAYILQKTQPTKNEFIGAYKTIARKLEWRINPSMVIKGNRNKEKVLMDEFLATQKEYDKKRKARKNGKKQKTVKG